MDEDEEEEEVKTLSDLTESGELEALIVELAKTQNKTLKKVEKASIEGIDDFTEDTATGFDWDEQTRKEITDFLNGIDKNEVPCFVRENKEPVLVDEDGQRTFRVS